MYDIPEAYLADVDRICRVLKEAGYVSRKTQAYEIWTNISYSGCDGIFGWLVLPNDDKELLKRLVDSSSYYSKLVLEVDRYNLVNEVTPEDEL